MGLYINTKRKHAKLIKNLILYLNIFGSILCLFFFSFLYGVDRYGGVRYGEGIKPVCFITEEIDMERESNQSVLSRRR